MHTTRFRTAHHLLAAAAGVLLSSALPLAAAADSADAGTRCARQFEEAQRIDMESFRDYDAEAFRAIHHPDAVTVFASGATFIGIDQIMGALASHFANREAVWAWTEVYRVVDGCRGAFILYDTTYSIASIGYSARALTGVTYSHRGGKWLAIADQGTPLPQSR